MQYLPSVSVIIPVHNGRGTIASCLNSLLNLDYPKDKLQILVVDNNSSDGSEKIIRSFPVTYSFEKKRGQPAALNNGIRLSKAEIIALTDCDCRAHPEWLKELIKVFSESNSIGGCGGQIKPLEPASLVEIYTDIAMRDMQRMAIAGDIYSFPFIIGCNCAYRRDVLEGAGMYDEGIFGAEDRDIAIRVSLKGYKLKYAPDAVIFHKYRQGLISALRQRFFYGYGLDLVNKKYPLLIDSKYKKVSLEFARFFSLSSLALKELLRSFIPKNSFIARKKFYYLVFHSAIRIAYITGIVWPKPTPKFKPSS